MIRRLPVICVEISSKELRIGEQPVRIIAYTENYIWGWDGMQARLHIKISLTAWLMYT